MQHRSAVSWLMLQTCLSGRGGPGLQPLPGPGTGLSWVRYLCFNRLNVNGSDEQERNLLFTDSHTQSENLEDDLFIIHRVISADDKGFAVHTLTYSIDTPPCLEAQMSQCTSSDCLGILKTSYIISGSCDNETFCHLKGLIDWSESQAVKCESTI